MKQVVKKLKREQKQKNDESDDDNINDAALGKRAAFYANVSTSLINRTRMYLTKKKLRFEHRKQRRGTRNLLNCLRSMINLRNTT